MSLNRLLTCIGKFLFLDIFVLLVGFLLDCLAFALGLVRSLSNLIFGIGLEGLCLGGCLGLRRSLCLGRRAVIIAGGCALLLVDVTADLVVANSGGIAGVVASIGGDCIPVNLKNES